MILFYSKRTVEGRYLQSYRCPVCYRTNSEFAALLKAQLEQDLNCRVTGSARIYGSESALLYVRSGIADHNNHKII